MCYKVHVHSTKLHKKNTISPLTPMLYMEVRCHTHLLSPQLLLKQAPLTHQKEQYVPPQKK